MTCLGTEKINHPHPHLTQQETNSQVLASLPDHLLLMITSLKHSNSFNNLSYSTTLKKNLINNSKPLA